MPVDASLRRELLREALAHRRDEARSRLGRLDATRPASEESSDPEEMLRVLMVRLWPRVRDRTATTEERSAFFAHLFSLREHALTDDLRFLDAWNNAYEALDPRDRDADLGAFLSAYADLLHAHAGRLEP